MRCTFFQAVRKIFLPVTLIWLLAATVSTTLAQQSVHPASRLEQTMHLAIKSASLSKTIETIVQQTHVPIIADGLSAVSTAEIDVKGSLREVLDRVGDRFDYTWREGSGGVVLLNKRFKDPKTAPQAHLREMRQVTSNILILFQTLNPDTNGFEWPSLEMSLADTFTLEQKRILLQGDRLYASALSPSQLQSLQVIIGSVTFGDACNSWKELLRVFSAMQRFELVLYAIHGSLKSFAVHDPLTDTNMQDGISIGSQGFTKKKL